ncbi:MAG: methionine--tRNA ligase [Candidatus Peregrinibacteria bacterium]|nr:methionine--tRNA ligase [Candidatus Peregrinibacteria bacterium]
MKKFLTTPIFYVNDKPHIGHAYCVFATDTLARYWRKKLGRENVWFLTGTDENSQKTVDAAAKEGLPVPEYLEKLAKNWKTTWHEIGIDFDDFIRTTEDRHADKVHELINKINDSGDIYEHKYVGKYCSGCETFLKDADLDENGHCPDHKKAPELLEEDNYFFRLSKYEKPLLEFYEKNPNWLQPDKRKNEVLNFIKGGLEDISISRESAEIGIDFPFDKKHKIYVWTEALMNYLTGCPDEDFWKGCTHIIGKDITKFHCIIWPAMLMSAGVELPQNVFAHGYFTVDGTKMSKTLGNVVSPVDLAKDFGNDAVRIGLLSSFEFGNDGDFSVSNFEDFYRSRLAGGVGNLFNRVVVLVNKFLDGNKPAGSNETQTEVLEKFDKHLESFEIRTAIETFFGVVDSANELLNKTEVWKLAKEDSEKAKPIFAELLNHLEILVEMAEVLFPEKQGAMKAMLGDADKVGDGEILFDSNRK